MAGKKKGKKSGMSVMDRPKAKARAIKKIKILKVETPEPDLHRVSLEMDIHGAAAPPDISEPVEIDPAIFESRDEADFASLPEPEAKKLGLWQWLKSIIW